jgi:alkanesulfonate monooxygenase SsuD/methylene tetrahydromethanopterin reductase-like flavin-dependent oxidoreductase (luciferase family)
MKLCTLFYPVVAATRDEAEDKRAAYETLANPMDQLLLLSEALNFDFATKGMDEPFTDEEIASIQGMQHHVERIKATGIANPTVRDFMEITGRGLLRNAWVGGPKEIADQMEEWFTEPVCDGFVIGPTHQPGTFEDFVKYVVPELQRRGLYRKEYTGKTLRENLGLPRPAIGSWKTKPQAAE